jgi:hypothetical protein
MSALTQQRDCQRRQQLANTAGGTHRVSLVIAYAARRQQLTLARSANATSLYWPASAANTSSTTANQGKMLFGQAHWFLRVVLFGTLLTLYRLHVVHLRKITDPIARRFSVTASGGGAVKRFLMRLVRADSKHNVMMMHTVQNLEELA